MKKGTQSEALTLESLSYQIEEKGKEWNTAKQVAERADELRKILLADIQNRHEAGVVQYDPKAKISETKLERIARGSDEFRGHIEETVKAKKDANDKYMEYEALKNLFDATRSAMALERARASIL